MKIAALATSVIAAGLLVSCSPAGTSTPAPASQTAVGGAADAILAQYGLSDLSATELVEHLDATQDDRAAGPTGSVRPHEVIISDGQQEASVPLPEDQFYLAIAPYLTRTHDCFNHNLASCQGELVAETLAVTITDDAGNVLVDEDVTTHANGFAGFWLPADITGTLTVEYEGKSVSAPFGTSEDDPTCVTTLKLQ